MDIEALREWQGTINVGYCYSFYINNINNELHDIDMAGKIIKMWLFPDLFSSTDLLNPEFAHCLPKTEVLSLLKERPDEFRNEMQRDAGESAIEKPHGNIGSRERERMKYCDRL